MNISEQLKGIGLTDTPEGGTLTWGSLGTMLGDSHIGGCLRAAWYRFFGAPVTNLPSESMILGRKITRLVKREYETKLTALSKLLAPVAAPPTPELGWSTRIDNVTVYGEVSGWICTPSGWEGVLVKCGSGYGFRSDVFGSKTKEAKPKDDHLFEAWALLTFPPVTNVRAIHILYVDYDGKDTISFEVSSSPLSKDMFAESVRLVGNKDSRPECSYERQWSDRLKVSKIFAAGRISKTTWEKFKTTGEGGDWQCRYCPWADQCREDGE